MALIEVSPFADHRNVAFHIWAALNLPKPTDIQYDIIHYMQHGDLSKLPAERRRLIVEAFRGVGKSWLAAAEGIGVLHENPQLKIMVVSASKERADAFSLFVKRVIELIPAFRHLRPRDDQRTSNIAFDVGPALPDQSPSVKSVGITGQITGSRADLIIADDIETPRNSQTVQQREKLAELVKEFDSVLKPGGRIIYLGTPQLEESLYNKLPERGYDKRVWPGRYPKTAKSRENYGNSLAPIIAKPYDADPSIAWQPTEPIRFDDTDLLEREASYGRSGFLLQFMLDTSLSDAERYPLKLSDLIVMDVDREVAPIRTTWASSPELIVSDIQSVGFTGDRLYRPMYRSADFEEYTGSVMTIDPSGRGKDESGYAVTKMLRGMIYCRRAGGVQGGYEDASLELLAHIARAEKVKLIRIEGNFGDGMFTKLFGQVLQRIYPCVVEEITNHGQKERRIIDIMEPVLNQHRLVMDASILRADQVNSEPKYQLFHQFTRLTKDRNSLRHDDRIEALSMACAYWMEELARNVDVEEDRRAEELFEQELREFEDLVRGHSRPAPNFYDVI